MKLSNLLKLGIFHKYLFKKFAFTCCGEWSPGLLDPPLFFRNCLKSFKIDEDFLLFKPLEVGDGNLFVELNGDLDWTKSNMDCVDPFLDLKEFEKDNVDVELLEDPDDDKLFVVLLDGDEVVWFFLKCSGESEFGKNGDFTDLTVTDVPEGIPLTLSRLESCILESLVILSTFVLFSTPFVSFLVMVVCPPRVEIR